MFKLLLLDELCPKTPNFHFLTKSWSAFSHFWEHTCYPANCKIVLFILTILMLFFNVQTVTSGWVVPKDSKFSFFDKKLKRIWSFLRACHLPHSHYVYRKIVYLFIHNPSIVRPFFNVQTVTSGWVVPKNSKFSFFWQKVEAHLVIFESSSFTMLSSRKL